MPIGLDQIFEYVDRVDFRSVEIIPLVLVLVHDVDQEHQDCTTVVVRPKRLRVMSNIRSEICLGPAGRNPFRWQEPFLAPKIPG